MANFTFENATLKLVYETGVNESGNSIFSSKTYRNLRANVTADKLAAVVQAFISLSKNPVIHASVSTTEKVEL